MPQRMVKRVIQTDNRFTTEALVIKEMKIGESDRLVTLLSREYGIIKAFASGAKNLKSKKASGTALLTYGSFSIKNKNGRFSMRRICCFHERIIQ
jgi:DNA repair protein RecO